MTFKWGRAYVLAGAAVFLSTFAVPANAISFTGTFNITSDAATDPSLVIVTNPALGTDSAPINFNLNSVGNTATFNSLFQIGTPENSIQSDDTVWKNMTVAFSFSAPPPAFGGPVTGQTRGRAVFFGLIQFGELDWDSSIQLAFGNGGLLGIELFDTTFGLSHNGQPDFEDVKGVFTLLALPNDRAGENETPLPGAVWLFGTVLAGGAGFGRWRKKRKVQLAVAA